MEEKPVTQNSPRMQWPYPSQEDDPWFDYFQDFIRALDSSGYAHREDRSIIWTGGGTLSWSLASETFEWTETINIYSPIGSRLLQIAAGTVADWAEGEVVYVMLTRQPLENASASFVKQSQLPDNDNAMAVAIRIGDVIYFRTGISLEDGNTSDGIAPVPGGSGGTDPNAIHVNTSNEISGIAPKASPVVADLIVIEDSENSNAKKRVQLGDIPGTATDANAIHDNVANEIIGIAAKTVPVANDIFIIEDSEAGGVKKRLPVSALPSGGNDSLPGVQQVLFVDKTGDSYTADGTIQFPYNSIDAACTAANALTPGPTNRIGIIVMPGRYNERFRLYNYCYVIGTNKDACVMHYASGSMVLATNVTSGVWNMTIQEESTFYLSWISQASNIEYHNCHFIGAGNSGNVFYTEDTAVLRCWHCTVENTDPDLEVSWCLESSSQYFYDCEFYGLLYAATTATTSRYYFKDCRIVGSIYTAGQNSLECYNTDIDATENTTYLNPIYIYGNEEFVKLIRMELIPPGSAYDITFGTQIDIECDNVRMKNGIDRFGFILSQEGEAHIGGNYNCYSTWTNMVQASWASRGQYRIVLHKDISEAALNMSQAHDPITIDGQGRFTISHPTPGTTITIQTGWSGDWWTFERLIFGDSLQISTPSVGLNSAAIFKHCNVNGAIKHSVGANLGTLMIELIHTEVVGNSTDFYALMISHGTGNAAKILVRGDSYVQGYTGYPAVYWHTQTGSGDLRMAFATILHGSLGANNPFGDDGTPTTPITHKATHCRFNSDPEASANYINSVPPGQRFNSFDPAVAF